MLSHSVTTAAEEMNGVATLASIIEGMFMVMEALSHLKQVKQQGRAVQRGSTLRGPWCRTPGTASQAGIAILPRSIWLTCSGGCLGVGEVLVQQCSKVLLW